MHSDTVQIACKFIQDAALLDFIKTDIGNDEAIQKYGHSKCQERLSRILSQLTVSPKFTTVRVNTLTADSSDIKTALSDFLKEFDVRVHPILDDVFLIESPANELQLHPDGQQVVTDLQCAISVLRGAHVYVPGILGVPTSLRKGDKVAVYANLHGKCLKGSTKWTPDNKSFVGNGVAHWSRTDLFTTKTASGLGIEMTERLNPCPSLGDFLTESILLQNLPSIVCGHVLDPNPGDIVLDMCAAPGGKTTHLANLMQNQGVIIAIDKTESKVAKIKSYCRRFGITNVAAFKYDSTTLRTGDVPCQCLEINCPREPPYPSESFDKILLDAPCSALGQRPQLYNKMTAKELQSYPKLQRKLIKQAIELLKVSGTLVYSTCTITVQENESIVKWILENHSNLQLAVQKPYVGHSGFVGAGLSDEELRLLQRFGNSDDTNDVNSDTIGFFIAKFVKT